MLKRSKCVLVVFILLACNMKDRKKMSEVQTDLGPVGNEKVYERFEAFKQSGKGCDASLSNPANSKAKRTRVMVTGFGLFQGVDYNISGVVAESMMDPEFWPESTNLFQGPGSPADKLSEASDGRLDSEDQGAKAVTRNISVNGRDLTVCFMLLDVYWDLAGAIVIDQIEKFQPDFVFMTGRGAEEPVYEWGAINNAKHASGFESDGTVAAESTPVNEAYNYVLPTNTIGVSYNAPLLWDNKRLVEVTKDDIAALGFAAIAPPAPRPSNDYICNNISYIVVHAVKGVNVQLAGEKISLKITVPKIPKVGFFHYPAAAKNEKDSVFRWARVIAKTIITEI
ncbi:MAG: hypothetical protein AB7T49_15125 [Oligoflexales bacterium]